MIRVDAVWLAVLDGLKTGEQVMVDGFQKLRGGAPVKAVPWRPAASGGAPGAAASGAATAGAASAPASGAMASAPSPAASGK